MRKRILLSPIVFIWGIVIIICCTIFPIPLLIGYSIIGIVIEPFCNLLGVKGLEPFVEYPSKYNYIGHILGITVYIWSPFLFVYLYILEGEIIGLND